jgi:isoleucyl-tRNA synthetase
MTPELEAEGYARNVIRSIQAFRKELGLKPENKVKIILIVDEELKCMLENHKNYVAERTNSRELLIETASKETFKKKTDFKVKDKKGVVAIIV